jgi:hypothetical protein
MAADLTRESMTTQTAGATRTDLNGSNWAENVKKAYLGMQVDSAFKARLEALARKDFESGGLQQLNPDSVRLLVSSGGSSLPESPRPDVMRDLVSLGKLNEAAMLNVFHITGDSFMIKSALNVYRQGNREEVVEPVQETDGQMG